MKAAKIKENAMILKANNQKGLNPFRHGIYDSPSYREEVLYVLSEPSYLQIRIDDVMTEVMTDSKQSKNSQFNHRLEIVAGSLATVDFSCACLSLLSSSVSFAVVPYFFLSSCSFSVPTKITSKRRRGFRKVCCSYRRLQKLRSRWFQRRLEVNLWFFRSAYIPKDYLFPLCTSFPIASFAYGPRRLPRPLNFHLISHLFLSISSTRCSIQSSLSLQIRNPLLRFCIIDFCYIIVNQFKFKFCIRFLQLVQSIFA
ncbi:hypothetical protein LXL04_027544 [Taraxacum kok-saghyz]